MKKLIFGFSLVCAGLLPTACIDKHEEVDEESRPEWLGGSIYEELSTRQSGKLEGTFNTYLRLVDDLGYGEVLGRTGSKTVFPANDEAFDRFFASGQWPGVSKYEDLSTAQKKLLLYTSMLDNAMLVNMMSNVAGDGGVIRGQAMKHTTSVSVIDTVTHSLKPSQLYVNNPYFKRFDQKSDGIYFVADATEPPMIHFTREFMLNHSLTTSGPQSDFSILMGQDYDEKEQPGYVFRNKIIHKDVTCQNGYIHQVENVIVPPGNMAQMLKTGSDTKLFSRMLDRFAVPVYNASVTRDYKASAAQYGWAEVDSIFEVRYMSNASYDNKVANDRELGINTSWLLRFDPGWNQYYLATGQTGSGDGKQSDVAAILVPEDEAVRGYFLPAGAYNGNMGSGAFLIDRYGKKPNTLENLEENIDSIPQDKIQTILRNLMQTQFTKTVPSLFDAVTDNASDLMGLSLSDVRKDASGAYDVRIANNGVVYVLNRMIAPPDFSSVLAPALVSDQLKVVNWVIQNRSATSYSGSSTVNKYEYSIDLDYYTYLLAMSANYAQFLPTDQAFSTYYVNAASLSTQQPEVVRFYYDAEKYKATSGLGVSHWKYDPVTRQVGDSIGEYDLAKDYSVSGRPAYKVVKALLNELINMHTIVLKKGETLGQNKYYTTKLGAGVKVTGNTEGSTVATSYQNGAAWPQPAAISKVYPENNGVAYQLDGLLQPPTQSVYSVLNNNPQFSEFRELCMFFDNVDFMKWLGISTTYDTETKMKESDQYIVFEKPHSKEYNPENDETTNAHYSMATYENDYVVKFFNTFNYTVYAPNNDAMEKAYAQGLPRYTDILDTYEKSEANELSEDYATVSARLLQQVKLLRQFVRYHFQNTTVFANNYGDTGYYSTFTPDANNINLKVKVTDISGGRLTVRDAAGVDHTIVDGAAGKVANAMTRDVILDARFDEAKTIYTSSFAVVHEIDTPLCPCADGSYTTLLSNYARRR